LSFGLTGCALGWSSLHDVHVSILKRTSRMRGHALTFFLVFLASFGISLGRFGRANSWDILAPFRLVHQVRMTLLSKQAVLFALAMFFLMGLGYLATFGLPLFLHDERER
jgi:uncharacterized membrane protein